VPQGLSLVVLAAGLSTRYGKLKQLDPLGPKGEAIMDYNVFDAVRAGFDRVVYVVREEIEEEIRSHVAAVLGNGVDTAFIRQEMADVPGGFRTPPERIKPWGTGHAVLAAATVLEGSFAVCNADDLYGPSAFRKLQAHLGQSPPPTEAALVGYTLTDTLSGSGGVSRGVCVLAREGLLERVIEVQNIREVHGFISGLEVGGDSVDLSGREIVSMNLWGFTQPVVDLLRRQFQRFLERWGADPASEFYLSTAINNQVQIGATRTAVLTAREPWFGVTHAEDHKVARETLLERIARGDYPDDLAAAFRRGV